mmetsp:Transcript_24297/g.50503  ORF Transcript_24297/g.50503 Transcript_24297/m.50503 type:complete len:87 (+) Transcript_24297:1249-1509(+)
MNVSWVFDTSIPSSGIRKNAPKSDIRKEKDRVFSSISDASKLLLFEKKRRVVPNKESVVKRQISCILFVWMRTDGEIFRTSFPWNC